MHPDVQHYISKFEEDAERAGLYRRSLGRSERAFLENVWGPAFQYQFDGLQPEYPFKDFKGGQRFADFVYTKGGMRLIIEVDGFTTHARDISPGEFDDHLMRQNDLILSGWTILRFSAHQVEKRAAICQKQLLQAIGHWWTIAHGSTSPNEIGLWHHRKKLIVQLALRQGGVVRTVDLSRECSIITRTAHHWMERFVAEGIFHPVLANKRTMKYMLTRYDENTQ